MKHTWRDKPIRLTAGFCLLVGAIVVPGLAHAEGAIAVGQAHGVALLVVDARRLQFCGLPLSRRARQHLLHL